MGWTLFYKEPKKKRLQQIELTVLLVLLPVALFCGGRAYTQWKAFEKAAAIFAVAEMHLHEGNFPSAVEGFQKTLALYPEFYGAWEGLALSYYETHQFEKELDTYKSAVAVLPRSGELHRELGTAYHKAGDHRSELKHLTIACSLLGREDGFTVHLLDRAEKEVAGKVIQAPVGQDHDHDHEHEHQHAH